MERSSAGDHHSQSIGVENEISKDHRSAVAMERSSAGDHHSQSIGVENEGSVSGIVAQHYNKLEEKGVEERKRSRIFFMRNFNNWIKSMLIGDFVEKVKDENTNDHKIKVLDLGCGKGGDLLKWRKAGIAYMVCADIAETSVEQCRQRYQDMEQRSKYERHSSYFYKAEFVVADCTKENIKEKLKASSTYFDIVSVQFAFHYSFESLPQAEQMLKNISDRLRPGGYFIATMPDAYDIVQRLQASGSSSFGNSVFRIQFDNAESFPLFGAKYFFHLEEVVNCPEFLVHLPTLERLARRFSLRLIYAKKFEDMYEMYHKTEDGRQLLAKMQALETFPAFQGEELSSSSKEDYANACRVKEKERVERVGTLSVAEWEAISLYMAVAFVKERR